MNRLCKTKYDYEVAQFDKIEREKKAKIEEAIRVKANGGKPLNYFLVPKCYDKNRNKKTKNESDSDYYVVPLIYDRLSKPKEKSVHSKYLEPRSTFDNTSTSVFDKRAKTVSAKAKKAKKAKKQVMVNDIDFSSSLQSHYLDLP